MSRGPRVVLATNVALPALAYLFTGDRDLLMLPGEFLCLIVTADPFLSALSWA